jgi:hypothetical protein
MSSFDDFLDSSQEEEENQQPQDNVINPYKTVKEFRDFLVLEYLKVGLFCKMSPNEYLDTPSWMVEGISDKIDERLAPYIEKAKSRADQQSDGKGGEPLDYNHLALLLFGSALFGSDEDP